MRPRLNTQQEAARCSTTSRPQQSDRDKGKKKIYGETPWPSNLFRQYGNKFGMPVFPPAVHRLREHWHLMHSVISTKENLLKTFAENFKIIKSPPSNMKYVSNIQNVWDFCTTVSRNGMDLPIDIIEEYSSEKVEVIVNDLKPEKVPAVKCHYELSYAFPTITVFILNGPNEYTYFAAEELIPGKNIVDIHSFFRQFQDETFSPPKSIKGMNGLEDMMHIHINGEDYEVDDIDVFFEIRKFHELGESRNVLADMVKKYYDKFSTNRMHKYFPESRNAINIVKNENNRFVLAKVEGVIVGMAMFHIDVRTNKISEMKSEIRYFVEPDFFRIGQRIIFKNLLALSKRTVKKEIAGVRTFWGLFTSVLHEESLAFLAMAELKFKVGEDVGEIPFISHHRIFSIEVIPENSGPQKGGRSRSPTSSSRY